MFFLVFGGGQDGQVVVRQLRDPNRFTKKVCVAEQGAVLHPSASREKLSSDHVSLVMFVDGEILPIGNGDSNKPFKGSLVTTWRIISVNKYLGSLPFTRHLGHLEGEQPC